MTKQNILLLYDMNTARHQPSLQAALDDPASANLGIGGEHAVREAIRAVNNNEGVDYIFTPAGLDGSEPRVTDAIRRERPGVRIIGYGLDRDFVAANDAPYDARMNLFTYDHRENVVTAAMQEADRE